MHRSDYALIGIATVASLLILIPLGVGLADAQISNSTLTITNSTGTFDVPAFTNSTGTYLISEWVPPYVEPTVQPVVQQPVIVPTPVLPTGSLNLQIYDQPVYEEEVELFDETQTRVTLRTIIGQDYNLVEDFTTGKAVWTSTIPKIQDGFTVASDGSGIPTWKYYNLEQLDNKIIFNSNSVGGFVFDLPTCSYSINENDWNGAQVIPSVSSVATGLVNGEWVNLEVNDELCDVDVVSDKTGLTLTSTKYLETDGVTTLTSVNGTTTTQQNHQKFTQIIDIDTKKGIKETWVVTNTDQDVELGVSQTLHTSSTIEIANEVIDIEALNGQSFSKQYIQDNKAEILAITDSLNYDFSVGIESLSNVNIIYDGTYKINLDYADSGLTGELIIDPTVTFTQTSGVFSISNLSPFFDITSASIGGTAISATDIASLSTAITNGDATWANPSTLDFVVTAGGSLDEVLVVAGGGAGGGGYGGGGGAGGLKYSTGHSVTPQTYTITIGKGGTGIGTGTSSYNYYSSISGEQGGSSIFDSISTTGGGGGRNYYSNAQSGGSGGGGSVYSNSGGSGTSGEGNSGGSGSGGGGVSNWTSGGGGGHGSSGSTGSTSSARSGHGGDGTEYNISGTAQFYAGG